MAGKSNSWTPKRRAEQAEKIRRIKPWLTSTGPKTAQGKEISSQNAYRHGFYSADYAALCALLVQQKKMTRALLDLTGGKL